MKKILALLLLVVIAFVYSGCETAEGFGRDLQKLGRNIEES